MRKYLVLMDDTPESVVALRFAARRAVKTQGAVEIIGIVPKANFMMLAGVEAAMNDERREAIEELVQSTLDAMKDESRFTCPHSVSIGHGDAVALIMEKLAQDDSIAALVLASAATGHPGKLVGHFTGNDMGKFPCPIMVIPGGLSEEDLQRLS
jgi:nucleotide-binding universal stress UspA family protein